MTAPKCQIGSNKIIEFEVISLLTAVKDSVLYINQAHEVQCIDMTFTVNTQTDKKESTKS